jgi:hypothetical protein
MGIFLLKKYCLFRSSAAFSGKAWKPQVSNSLHAGGIHFRRVPKTRVSKHLTGADGTVGFPHTAYPMNPFFHRWFALANHY